MWYPEIELGCTYFIFCQFDVVFNEFSNIKSIELMTNMKPSTSQTNQYQINMEIDDEEP